MARSSFEQEGYLDAVDPLGASADPRRYVPLQSSERALQALSEALDDGRSPLLLDGVGGVGKTMLLRVLGERERRRGRRVVFSPFLHLPPEDVARWLLHLLNQSFPASQPADDALLADVQRYGARTVVLVDEIQCTPEASLQRLAELAHRGAPQLVVVAAATLGPRLDALLPVLRPERRVTLPSALRACEMEALRDAILAHPALPRALRELPLAARDAILRDARGVPSALTAELVRRLHEAGEPEEDASDGPAMWPELSAPAPAAVAHEAGGAREHGEAALARGEADLAHGAEPPQRPVPRVRPSELDDDLGILRAAREPAATGGGRFASLLAPARDEAGAPARPVAAQGPGSTGPACTTGPARAEPGAARRPGVSTLDLRRPPAAAVPAPTPIQRRPLRARPAPPPRHETRTGVAAGAAAAPGHPARARQRVRAATRAGVARAAALPVAAGRGVRRAGRAVARSSQEAFARLAAALRAGGAAAAAAFVALGVAIAAGPRRAGRAAASAAREMRAALGRGAAGIGARRRAFADGTRHARAGAARRAQEARAAASSRARAAGAGAHAAGAALQRGCARGLRGAAGACARSFAATAAATGRVGTSVRTGGAATLRAARAPFAWTASAGARAARATGAGVARSAAAAGGAHRTVALRAKATGAALSRALCAIGRAEEALALRAVAGVRAAAHATADAARELSGRLAPLAGGRAFAVLLAVVFEVGMLWLYASAPAEPRRAALAAAPTAAAGPAPVAAPDPGTATLASVDAAGAREALAAPEAGAPVRVHVNARPWAHIRVDGVDVGPTPLSHVHLMPGPHAFEAAFPDGRRVERVVEITSEQRFVALH